MNRTTESPKGSLEWFLEDQCGMAPTFLIERYEEHREFIERSIAEFDTESPVSWEAFSLSLWMLLPDLPDGWQI